MNTNLYKEVHLLNITFCLSFGYIYVNYQRKHIFALLGMLLFSPTTLT